MYLIMCKTTFFPRDTIKQDILYFYTNWLLLKLRERKRMNEQQLFG